MWNRQIVPYFDVYKAKMLGPFKINIHSYGEKLNNDPLNIKKTTMTIYLKISTI